MKWLTDKKEQALFLFSFGMVVVVTLFLVVLIAAQIYVRWNVNQDFTFLGGLEMEALTLGMFSLLMTLLYTYRPQKGSE